MEWMTAYHNKNGALIQYQETTPGAMVALDGAYLARAAVGDLLVVVEGSKRLMSRSAFDLHYAHLEETVAEQREQEQSICPVAAAVDAADWDPAIKQAFKEMYQGRDVSVELDGKDIAARVKSAAIKPSLKATLDVLAPFARLIKTFEQAGRELDPEQVICRAGVVVILGSDIIAASEAYWRLWEGRSNGND